MHQLRVVRHDTYVILSYGISFVGAYCGIIICEQLRLCSRKNQAKLLSRHMIMLFMAISIGGIAIWCMHFVGMSTMSFEDEFGNALPLYYRTDLTVVSLVIVIILCYIGIYISSHDTAFIFERLDRIDAFIEGASRMSISEIKKMRSAKHILLLALFQGIDKIFLGASIMALGVCIMHYIGMMAIVLDDNVFIVWDVGLIVLSVIIAIVASTAAYWICFRLLALYPYVEILRTLSALIAALAVNGMHFTGMSAGMFMVGDEGLSYTTNNHVGLLNRSDSLLGAVIASMAFLWILIFLTVADLRAWFYNHSRTLREIEHLMREFEKDHNQNHQMKTLTKRYRLINGVRSTPVLSEDSTPSSNNVKSSQKTPSSQNFFSFGEAMLQSTSFSTRIISVSSALIARPALKIFASSAAVDEEMGNLSEHSMGETYVFGGDAQSGFASQLPPIVNQSSCEIPSSIPYRLPTIALNHLAPLPIVLPVALPVVLPSPICAI